MRFSPDSSRPGAAARIAVLSIVALLPSLLDVGVARASPETDRGLEMIHRGRLREGREALHANARAHTGDPTAQFYAGVASWWHHISEFGNEKAADEAIAFFDAGLAAGFDESTPQGRFEAGTSYILKGHLEGSRGSVLGAAFDARRGKKLLDLATAEEPGNEDVGFALGAYDYYADRLPSIVKGLRAILFLPGGNAARGMRELDAAARKGKVFGCEASLVLADIYGSPLEDKYDLSLELMEALVAKYPDNPFFRAGRSEIRSEIGDYEGALADMKLALGSVAPGDASLRAGLQYQEARLLDKAFASEAARLRLEPMVGQTKGTLPPGQHVRLRFLLGEVLEKLGERDRALAMYRELSSGELDSRMRKRVTKKLGSDLAKVRRSYRDAQPAIGLLREGRAAEAEEALRTLKEASPKDPVLLFFLGESLFVQGESEEAKLLYDEARLNATADDAWIRGYTLVRCGDIAIAGGDRELALKRYQQAAIIEKWHGRGGIVAYRLARVASMPASPPEGRTGRNEISPSPGGAAVTTR